MNNIKQEDTNIKPREEESLSALYTKNVSSMKKITIPIVIVFLLLATIYVIYINYSNNKKLESLQKAGQDYNDQVQQELKKLKSFY